MRKSFLLFLFFLVVLIAYCPLSYGLETTTSYNMTCDLFSFDKDTTDLNNVTPSVFIYDDSFRESDFDFTMYFGKKITPDTSHVLISDSWGNGLKQLRYTNPSIDEYLVILWVFDDPIRIRDTSKFFLYGNATFQVTGGGRVDVLIKDSENLCKFYIQNRFIGSSDIWNYFHDVLCQNKGIGGYSTNFTNIGQFAYNYTNTTAYKEFTFPSNYSNVKYVYMVFSSDLSIPVYFDVENIGFLDVGSGNNDLPILNLSCQEINYFNSSLGYIDVPVNVTAGDPENDTILYSTSSEAVVVSDSFIYYKSGCFLGFLCNGHTIDERFFDYVYYNYNDSNTIPDSFCRVFSQVSSSAFSILLEGKKFYQLVYHKNFENKNKFMLALDHEWCTADDRSYSIRLKEPVNQVNYNTQLYGLTTEGEGLNISFYNQYYSLNYRLLLEVNNDKLNISLANSSDRIYLGELSLTDYLSLQVQHHKVFIASSNTLYTLSFDMDQDFTEFVVLDINDGTDIWQESFSYSGTAPELVWNTTISTSVRYYARGSYYFTVAYRDDVHDNYLVKECSITVLPEEQRIEIEAGGLWSWLRQSFSGFIDSTGRTNFDKVFFVLMTIVLLIFFWQLKDLSLSSIATGMIFTFIGLLFGGSSLQVGTAITLLALGFMPFIVKLFTGG